MNPLDNEFLNAAEVKELTGTAQPDEQEIQLTGLGLPWKRRGKRVLVSRFHTREWLSGRPVAPSRGINLALVR